MSANSKAGSDPQPPNLGGTKRGSFGSKLGIVLATAGSAVGLGNVWRFPYMTGENGGAAFILVYIVCILLLGILITIVTTIIYWFAYRSFRHLYVRLKGILERRRNRRENEA